MHTWCVWWFCWVVQWRVTAVRDITAAALTLTSLCSFFFFLSSSYLITTVALNKVSSMNSRHTYRMFYKTAGYPTFSSLVSSGSFNSLVPYLLYIQYLLLSFPFLHISLFLLSLCSFLISFQFSLSFVFFFL